MNKLYFYTTQSCCNVNNSLCYHVEQFLNDNNITHIKIRLDGDRREIKYIQEILKLKYSYCPTTVLVIKDSNQNILEIHWQGNTKSHEDYLVDGSYETYIANIKIEIKQIVDTHNIASSS